MRYIEITDDMKETAKSVNLINFLNYYYPGEVIYQSGEYAYVKEDLHSLKFMEESRKRLNLAYCDYAQSCTEGSGDNINYLMNYHNFSYPEAIVKLLEYAEIDPPSERVIEIMGRSLKTKENILPDPDDSTTKSVKQYLEWERKLDKELIEECFEKGIIYGCYGKNKWQKNAVFINKETDFFCVKGVSSVRFNANCSGNGYWEYSNTDKDKAKRLYICEAPIDALSLYQLLKSENSAFVAMSGLMPERANAAIKDHPNANIIIAVDWDERGNDFYQKHFEGVKRIKPKNTETSFTKDWNDVVKMGTA